MQHQLKLVNTHPLPLHDEDPVEYADRIGQWHLRGLSDADRRATGLYLTPPKIACLMARLSLGGSRGEVVRLLDPSSGSGTLAAAACVALASSRKPPKQVELVAYELDPELGAALNAALSYLQRWLKARKVELRVRLIWDDFLLTNAGALEGNILPFEEGRFDVVICNPPYFKLPKSDSRALACNHVVHGQPNIYALFMAVSAKLLSRGGRFVFITPRSFTSGAYFHRFLDFFLDTIRPTHFHLFASRKEAFDDVLQETVITAGNRRSNRNGWPTTTMITISSSEHAGDLETRLVRTLPYNIVVRGSQRHRILHLPTDPSHDDLLDTVTSWPSTLHENGWEVSTGPVVAFRATAHMRNQADGDSVPLLWLQNIGLMRSMWPLKTKKSQYMRQCAESAPLLLPSRNYVLIRRISAKEEKRRLTCAPFIGEEAPAHFLGLENHLNYIHKPGGELSVSEAFGIAALLNSSLLDTYFRISNGSTQVNATDLRRLPMPHAAVIRRIGLRVRLAPHELDRIVAEETGCAG